VAVTVVEGWSELHIEKQTWPARASDVLSSAQENLKANLKRRFRNMNEKSYPGARLRSQKGVADDAPRQVKILEITEAVE